MVWRFLSLTLIAVWGLAHSSSFAQVPNITEFPIPVPESGSPISNFVQGPDGALWFIGAAIGRITTDGAVSQFPLPSSSRVVGLTAGPDQALWFTDIGTAQIGRISTTGDVTEFPVAGATPSSGVFGGIAQGSDGALWFVQTAANKIGRITTTGSVTEFPIPSVTPLDGSGTSAITSGPDGALWFTEFSSNKIGRIGTDGTITEFPLPTGLGGPMAITAGPDGALWFIQTNTLGRITTGGAISEFPMNYIPVAVTAGPDGAVWFTEDSGGSTLFKGIFSFNPAFVGRITPAGDVTEFPVPAEFPNGFGLGGITTGPDGNLWFTESTFVDAINSSSNFGPAIGQIGRIVPADLPPSPLLASVLPSSRTVTVGTTATAFATILNTAPVAAAGCGISLVSNIPASFLYQTTDPTNNALTGSPNTPVTIPAAPDPQHPTSQSFVIALTPNTPFIVNTVAFAFACTSVPPAPFFGINTLDLVGSSGPLSDIVAEAATLNNDGIANIPGATGTGFFAVATVNLSVAGTVTVTGGSSPTAITRVTICQTNPTTGNCLAPPTPFGDFKVTVNANDEPTFAVFITGLATVPFLPASNRASLSFSVGGTPVGSTSVALRTQ
jgi:virginiamycin B lyase